jgi:hypothetical protein
MALYRLGQLNCGRRIVGRTVSHGCHPDHRGAIGGALNREDDDTRAVLDAFFPSGPVLVMP